MVLSSCNLSPPPHMHYNFLVMRHLLVSELCLAHIGFPFLGPLVSQNITSISWSYLQSLWQSLLGGDNWANQQIVFFTDNQSVTEIWRSGCCKDKDMMRLVRALFLFTARRNINILMKHIPGNVNLLADFLSRLLMDKFLHTCHRADRIPTSISSVVWDI